MAHRLVVIPAFLALIVSACASTSDVEELQIDVDALESQVNSLEDIVNELTNLPDLTGEVGTVTEALLSLDARVDSLEDRVETLESEGAVLARELAATDESVMQLQSATAQNADDLERLTVALDSVARCAIENFWEIDDRWQALGDKINSTFGLVGFPNSLLLECNPFYG
jgi:chromosome segregation ATPase